MRGAVSSETSDAVQAIAQQRSARRSATWPHASRGVAGIGTLQGGKHASVHVRARMHCHAPEPPAQAPSHMSGHAPGRTSRSPRCPHTSASTPGLQTKAQQQLGNCTRQLCFRGGGNTGRRPPAGRERCDSSHGAVHGNRREGLTVLSGQQAGRQPGAARSMAVETVRRHGRRRQRNGARRRQARGSPGPARRAPAHRLQGRTCTRTVSRTAAGS